MKYLLLALLIESVCVALLVGFQLLPLWCAIFAFPGCIAMAFMGAPNGEDK